MRERERERERKRERERERKDTGSFVLKIPKNTLSLFMGNLLRLKLVVK